MPLLLDRHPTKKTVFLEGPRPRGRGPGGADEEVQEPNMLYKNFAVTKGQIKTPDHF